jgi:hypothetical protein
MPRKAPSNCEEVRLTLGNFERNQLDELATAKKTQLYLQPFQYVLPVAAVGAAGYAGLAWFFQWWPFEPKDTKYGLGAVDEYFHDIYTDEGAFDEAEKDELGELDSLHAARVKHEAENPAPTGFFGQMVQKQNILLINSYPKRRTSIIAKFARLRILWAEKAADLEAQSEYV